MLFFRQPLCSVCVAVTFFSVKLLHFRKVTTEKVQFRHIAWGVFGVYLEAGGHRSELSVCVDELVIVDLVSSS